jgi:hypothetical protein
MILKSLFALTFAKGSELTTPPRKELERIRMGGLACVRLHTYISSDIHVSMWTDLGVVSECEGGNSGSLLCQQQSLKVEEASEGYNSWSVITDLEACSDEYRMQQAGKTHVRTSE